MSDCMDRLEAALEQYATQNAAAMAQNAAALAQNAAAMAQNEAMAQSKIVTRFRK